MSPSSVVPKSDDHFERMQTLPNIPQEIILRHRTILYIVGLAFCTMVYVLSKKLRKRESPALQPRTREEHSDLINFIAVGQLKSKSLDDRQAARARPNYRLKQVFGISNAFTSRSNAERAKFRNMAIEKMQRALSLDKSTCRSQEGDWTVLRAVARASVRQILDQARVGSLRLVDLIRVVTLKVSLLFLFDVSEDALDSAQSLEQLILIGQRINDLWIASKDEANNAPVWNAASNTTIHAALRAVCQTSPSNEAEAVDPLTSGANPMNWLLPAYETMWRTVLACVMEIRFRNAPYAHIWQETLQDYIEDLSSENFKGPSALSSVHPLCASDIVKETLRLYPPTRRVHRRFTEDGEDVKADIEWCHRRGSVDAFGSSPLRFLPNRWLRMRNLLGPNKTDKDVKNMEEERGFMPFATHCPAGQGDTQGFGLKMIALLAGVVSEGLKEDDDWMLEHEGNFGNLSVPLPADRAAFDEVFLIKGSCSTSSTH